MDNFTLPIKGGNVKDKHFSKSVDISSYPMDYVISPNDGVISNTDGDKCDGYVEIKHDTLYSKLCGVQRIKVSPGQFVKKGDILGFTSDKPINFSVVNSSGQKMDLEKLLTIGAVSKTISTKKSDTKQEKEKKQKEKPTTSSDYSDFGKNLLDLALFFPLAPARLAHSALNKEEIEPKTHKLTEEIQKIKKLL